MDFSEKICQFKLRISQVKEKILTEEAAKTSLILPFFQQILEYDVFNPSEFIPEFTADIEGIKKGEKIDYAIFLNSHPAILIEAKWGDVDLDRHVSQLVRYFSVTKAKFSILTDGIVYRFYTDLEQSNIMDKTPFLEINLEKIEDYQINKLKKFHKESFDIDKITSTASELKYTNKIKALIQNQLSEPSDDFVNFILNDVYGGRKTQNIMDSFRPIIKKSFNQFI